MAARLFPEDEDDNRRSREATDPCEQDRPGVWISEKPRSTLNRVQAGPGQRGFGIGFGLCGVTSG